MATYSDSFREDLTSRGLEENLSVCGCCELCAELFESISQWETIVSSCDLEQNGGKCKWFCQLCCCWVVFPTCAVKIHSWASCLARRLAQQVALVCGGLYSALHVPHTCVRAKWETTSFQWYYNTLLITQLTLLFRSQERFLVSFQVFLNFFIVYSTMSWYKLQVNNAVYISHHYIFLQGQFGTFSL